MPACLCSEDHCAGVLLRPVLPADMALSGWTYRNDLSVPAVLLLMSKVREVMLLSDWSSYWRKEEEMSSAQLEKARVEGSLHGETVCW